LASDVGLKSDPCGGQNSSKCATKIKDDKQRLLTQSPANVLAVAVQQIASLTASNTEYAGAVNAQLRDSEEDAD
jgi:hypothetical protein